MGFLLIIFYILFGKFNDFVKVFYEYDRGWRSDRRCFSKALSIQNVICYNKANLAVYGVMEVIELTAWLDSFGKALDSVFGDRVWFVGLQGSYSHGEAIEKARTF